MQTATGTRQEEENNIAILQQQHIVRLNVLFKTISIRNEKSVRKKNAEIQCTRELQWNMWEIQKREEKVRKEEVEMSPHSSSETIIPLYAVTITLPGPPLKVWRNWRSCFMKSTRDDRKNIQLWAASTTSLRRAGMGLSVVLWEEEGSDNLSKQQLRWDWSMAQVY